MKRAARIAWLLTANSFVVWVTVTRLSAALSSGESRDFEAWLEVLLEVLLPTLGIILELFRWRFAKWVNVGYLTIAGSFWLAEAVWWHADPFFGVLLIISIGLLILAGLTKIVYRLTKPDEPSPPAPLPASLR